MLLYDNIFWWKFFYIKHSHEYSFKIYITYYYITLHFITLLYTLFHYFTLYFMPITLINIIILFMQFQLHVISVILCGGCIKIDVKKFDIIWLLHFPDCLIISRNMLSFWEYFPSECYRDKLTIIVGGKDATCSTKCCTGAETDALIVIYH